MDSINVSALEKVLGIPIEAVHATLVTNRNEKESLENIVKTYQNDTKPCLEHSDSFLVKRENFPNCAMLPCSAITSHPLQENCAISQTNNFGNTHTPNAAISSDLLPDDILSNDFLFVDTYAPQNTVSQLDLGTCSQIDVCSDEKVVSSSGALDSPIEIQSGDVSMFDYPSPSNFIQHDHSPDSTTEWIDEEHTCPNIPVMVSDELDSNNNISPLHNMENNQPSSDLRKRKASGKRKLRSEEEKKDRRKEQNRRAAERCRESKRRKHEQFMNDHFQLERSHSLLRKQVTALQQQYDSLLRQHNTHMKTCSREG